MTNLPIINRYNGGILIVSRDADSPPFIIDNSGKVGIGTTPSSLLSVGLSAQFQVNSSGNIVKINNVNYSFPSSQGAASTVLVNDGAGNLIWSLSGGSIGNPVSGGTAGSVLFVGSTGSLAQNNAQFFWDNTNLRLGIGTTSPGAQIDVVNTTGAAILRVKGNAGSNSTRAEIQLDRTAAQRGGGLRIQSSGDSSNQWWVGVPYNGGTTSDQFQIGRHSTQPEYTTSAFLTILSDGNTGIGITSPTAKLNVVSSASQDALRVTQTGTGNALVVEDSANPDSSPFIINADGVVVAGHTSALNSYLPGWSTNYTPGLQGVGTTYSTPAWLSLTQYSTSTSSSGGAFLSLNKSNSSSVGSHTIVTSGQRVGGIGFSGSDGAKFLGVADIFGEVDGTPASNSMPGRLILATTASGASTATERMRIDNTGSVGIGSTNLSGSNLILGRNLTGSTTGTGVRLISTIQSDVTTEAIGMLSLLGTASASFTVPNLVHFYASQGTLGSSSNVTSQMGFYAHSTLIGGTTNYGFRARDTSAITSGKTSYAFFTDTNTATGGGTTFAFYASGTAPNYFGGTTTISTNSSTDALRITQTGSGNALTIQDEASDASPFIIDASGRLIAGHASAVARYYDPQTTTARSMKNQFHGLNAVDASLTVSSWSSSAGEYYAPAILLTRSKTNTIGSSSAVASGDPLGAVMFSGDDNTNFVGAAKISAFVDGSPSTNSMPGRLVFSTTASGSSTPTERMRIDSNGTVRITQTNSANAFVVEDVASDTTPFQIDADGNVKIGGFLETGGPNTFIKDYASGWSTTQVANTLYEIGRYTFTGSSQNVTFVGEFRGRVAESGAISRFIINARSGATVDIKTFVFQEEVVNLGLPVNIKLYHDPLTGVFVIGYISATAAFQNVGWSIKVHERSNYNTFQQVNTSTILSTTGLTEVPLSLSAVQSTSANQIITVNNATSALQITQSGTGTALSAAGNVQIDGTGYVKVASGTTAQRPSPATNGMMRYNTETNSFEGYIANSWSDVGGGGGTVRVALASHGFTAADVGRPLYLNGSTYTLAQADLQTTAEVAGILKRVLDTGTFEVCLSGEVSPVGANLVVGGGSLVAGEAYFLSATEAGKITTSPPTIVGQISKPIGIARTTSALDFFNMRGSAVGGSNVYTQIVLAGSTTTTQVTTIQNTSAYDSIELSGFMYLNATAKYRFSFKAQVTKKGNNSDYLISYNTSGDTPPTNFNMTVTAGGLVQVTLPALAGFTSALAQFSLNGPAVGASLPLQIDSNLITWQSNNTYRNRVINGDMRIAQRGTESGATASSLSNTFVPDRFSNYSFTGTARAQQLSITNLSGFTNTLRYTVGSASSRHLTTTRFEGFNVLDLVGRPVTASFWIRGSKAFTFGWHCYVPVSGSPVSLVKNVSVTTTWQRVVITFTMHSSLGSTTTGAAFESVFNWYPDQTALTSTELSWVSGDKQGITGASYTFNTANDWVELTGVQFEPGSVVTPFEMRPYASELFLCRRYCIVYGGSSFYEKLPFLGTAYSGGGYACMVGAPTMRITNPTFTFNALSNFAVYDGFSSYAITAIGFDSASIAAPSIQITAALTAGRAFFLQSNATTAARLTVSAEL